MSATYSPEDNKLRLYSTARLDAETYAKVKAAGFKWAPKQELFVAPKWSPAREDLLLEMCDEIDDEDYSPEERAADRAERFSGYRDKRTAKAIGHADTFDAGPSAFGHQSRARAERQAARHDRQRGNACSQWSKAEYWQQRTAGVIANALHKSDPATRRGRIITLETELRRFCPTARWKEHYELRLSYERAMLANEGGSATDVEMIPGGFIGKHQIERVNKSNVSGKPVSVVFVGGSRPRNIERLGADIYRAPTAEELVEFEKDKKERKAEAKANAAPVVPLINPTDADAERLQAIWNAREQDGHASKKRYDVFVPSTVLRLTQAQYSANSKGAYARLETIEVSETLQRRDYRGGGRVSVFKIRRGPGDGKSFYFSADRVIVITDKPQKPIPFDEVDAARAKQPTKESTRETLLTILEHAGNYHQPEDVERMRYDAAYAGWLSIHNGRVEWTDEACEAIKQLKAEQENTSRHMTPAGLLF